MLTNVGPNMELDRAVGSRPEKMRVAHYATRRRIKW